MNSDLSFRGRIRLYRNGELAHSQDNLVVSHGKALAIGRLVGSALSVLSHIAVGNGTDAVNPSNAALSNELGRAATEPPVMDGNTAMLAVDLPAGVGTGNLTEVGLFSSSTLFARARLTFVVPKSASDLIRIEWSVTAN